MSTRNAWLALALLILPASPALAADAPPEGDLKAIQGKWSMKDEKGDKVTYTIAGKALKVVAPSRTYEITLVLTPDAKPEKTVDFQINEAPDDAKGKTSKGIYKLDGEALVFCFSPQGDRPAKFESEGYEKIVVKLTRDKD